MCYAHESYYRTCGHVAVCCMLLQILDISAIVLANLCVSYIMTSQNEEVVVIVPVILHKR